MNVDPGHLVYNDKIWRRLLFSEATDVDVGPKGSLRRKMKVQEFADWNFMQGGFNGGSGLIEGIWAASELVMSLTGKAAIA